MKKIKFALLCEGSSDRALVEHLKDLLINIGFDEVSDDSPDLSSLPNPPGRDIKSKVDCLISLEPRIDAIFIHRDSDNAGIDERLAEIEEQTRHLKSYRVVPLIPVKMLETWLLSDIDNIRIVSGNPDSTINLPIPKLAHLERVSDPKKLLFESLECASGLSGRKLNKFKKRLGEMRYRLTIDLDPEGPINQLSSYQSFRNSLETLRDYF